MAQLITQTANENQAVVLPEGTQVKMVSHETFKGYKEALSGLNDENYAQVTAKLVRLGLGGGEVSQGGRTF